MITRIKELESERDSETRWAKQYFDQWEEAKVHIKELEEGIAIAYDYLKSKYNMDSVPLNKVSELYKLIDK